jgi:hypothetical protein
VSILQNAIDSITLSIEDYSSPDPRRLVSCTRNIFAGILLLFKHKLSQLSPPGSDEVLIKRQILPAIDAVTGLQWQGKGKNTVDVQQIKERLTNLRVVVDWQRVRRINAYRNDIEHYFSVESPDAVRALITDSFVVIRDFIRNELNQDPLNLFDVSTWGIMTKVAEVYEKEKQTCIEHINAVDWKYNCLRSALIAYPCPECGSGLIDVQANGPDRDTAEFTCQSCGEQWYFEGLASLALTDYFAEANYRSIKDGGDPVTITCPECNEDTYILEDDVCILCEGSVERVCQWCGQTIPPEEIDGEGSCGWCSHMMSKDD